MRHSANASKFSREKMRRNNDAREDARISDGLLIKTTSHFSRTSDYRVNSRNGTVPERHIAGGDSLPLYSGEGLGLGVLVGFATLHVPCIA